MIGMPPSPSHRSMSRGALAEAGWSLIGGTLPEGGDGPTRRGAPERLAYDRPVDRGRRRAGRLGLVPAAALVLALGLSASPATASGATSKPQPAGPHPSEIAKEPCQSDAQRELADALGVKGTVVDPTWVDHRYSCNYVYKNGAFTLSVQELSSWAQTYTYFHEPRPPMGNVGQLDNLGQGAFQTTDGSVVVRKDWKVLLVNVADLPPSFGVPRDARTRHRGDGGRRDPRLLGRRLDQPAQTG